MPKTQRQMDAIEKKIKQKEEEEKRARSKEKLEKKKRRRRSSTKLKCTMLNSYARSKNDVNEKTPHHVTISNRKLPVAVADENSLLPTMNLLALQASPSISRSRRSLFIKKDLALSVASLEEDKEAVVTGGWQGFCQPAVLDKKASLEKDEGNCDPGITSSSSSLNDRAEILTAESGTKLLARCSSTVAIMSDETGYLHHDENVAQLLRSAEQPKLKCTLLNQYVSQKSQEADEGRKSAATCHPLSSCGTPSPLHSPFNSPLHTPSRTPCTSPPPSFSPHPLRQPNTEVPLLDPAAFAQVRARSYLDINSESVTRALSVGGSSRGLAMGLAPNIFTLPPADLSIYGSMAAHKPPTVETETTALSTGREDRGGGGVAKGGGKAFWAPPEGTMTAGTRSPSGCSGSEKSSWHSPKRQDRLFSMMAMRLSPEHSGGSAACSSVASILDDYNPQDLEKTSVIAVAWAVLILIAVFSAVIAAIIIFFIVIPAGYQGRLLAFAFCKDTAIWREALANETAASNWCDNRIFSRDFRLETQCPCFSTALRPEVVPELWPYTGAYTGIHRRIWDQEKGKFLSGL